MIEQDVFAEFPEFKPGTVWLTGAGPGDLGLLTLHALHAIKAADVIIYDALVGQAILDLAPPLAEMVYAGKRGGKPSAKQPNITDRIIAEARASKRVLRLKGGDPYIFGRGGEEALALVEAGVEFRVIPGVTAAIAGAAGAGIPMTHRAANSSVTFVTGHGATGEVPTAMDWDAISKASPVLVFYMAMKHLGKICARLIECGRSGAEPVAVIANATLASEQVLITKLATAVRDVESAGIGPPAVVVVGPVVDLAAVLAPDRSRPAD